MDNDESSDILGGRLQVSPPGPAVWADPGRITLLLGFATVVALTWVRIGPHFRQWRETRYRKAMRRRHGIPDDDHRPFNVAYAAALQARRGLEGKSRNVTQQYPQGVSVEDGSQFPPTIDAPTVHQDFAPVPPPVGSHSGYQNGHASSAGYNTEAHRHYTPSYQDVAGPSTSHHVPFPQGSNNSHVPVTSAVRTARPANGRQSIATRTVHGKHALDDETDAEPETLAKKSRVDGEELIDGEEEREWREDGDDMDVDSTVPHGKRGAKRMASPDDDEGLAQSRAERRDKRARKVSMDQSADAPGDEMDEDELEDDLQYIHDVARGKKRDRAEAGSTFGGDDSLIDDDEKPHRHRRRRVASNRVSQSSSRGQKRVRDLDSVDSDDSEAERPKREYTRKKRGKRSDEEIVPLSNDPLCGGRRIGDEWEANGVQFKVGPNGQRLRQELVKKSRTRFPMPSDSQHPDRRANVDVYVETWLTEEEYQSAKERHELAWQDAPPTPPEFQTPGDVPDSPSKIGKNLLWSSMASRESPARRGALRQSIATNVGLRLSMLAPAPVSSNLRVSSVYQAPASPAVDSPKVHKSKSYSKWEKQDLEAAAMSKIREKQQLQRQLKAAPSIATQPSAPFSAPSAAPAAPKPTEKPAQSSTPSFGFLPASTPAAVNKCVVEPPKLNIPGSAPAVAPSNHSKPATPSFPFPASSGSAPSTTATKPGPPPSTSVPNFFSKPADPAPTPATAPTPSANGIPSFFAKPPQTSTPTGASAAPTPATAPKSTFSFAPTPTAASQATQQPINGAQTSKPEEPKQVPGGSLLSRLGMGPPPSAQGSSSSAFGFGKPASTPASTGSNPAATASPFGAPAKGASSSESAPKFSFGAPSKPASSAPPPAPTTNGTPAAATSTPKFSFGVNNAPAQPAAPAPSAPAPSPFQSSATNASSAPKSAFGFGNSSTPASSPFGGNSNTAAGSSPFGAPSGTNASGANPSPFGGPSAGSSTPTSNPSPFGAPANGSAKPSEAPKSAFSFGNNTTTPSAGTSMFGGAGAQNSNTPKTDVPGLKPTFSFASSSTPAFGGSSSTPTFGGSSTTSAFGGQSSTSAFGGSSSTPTFGAPSSTPAFGATSTPAGAPGPKASFSFANAAGSTPAAAKTESKPALSFNFGTSNSTSSSGAAPAAPSPSAFGFGAQPSSTTPATPAASSPFGAPAAQSGASAFGFGAPSSGSFSFGSNTGQNTQK